MSDPAPDPVRHVEIIRAERVRRLAEVLSFVGALPLVAAVAATFLPDSIRPPMAVLATLLAVGLVALFLLAPPLVALLSRSKLPAPLMLRHDDGTLRLVDAAGRTHWQLPSSDVGVAWQRRPNLVELVTATGDEAALSFGSAEAATRAVDYVRRHACDRRAYALALESDVYRLWRPALAWSVPSAAAMTLATADFALWPAIPVALGVGALGARGSRKVWLGADGVALEGRFRTRHVPYRAIVGVEQRVSPFGWTTIVLRLTSSREVRVATLLSSDRAALTHALLEEGLRMVERGEAAGTAAGALATEGSSLREWLAKVSTATRRADYRGAALDVERLVSIVRNPAARGAQRVAAALALRAEPSGVARLRVAAEVSTEPEVREALELLAVDPLDERRVERVLKRLSQAT
jgi:hypothetical protein